MWAIRKFWSRLRIVGVMPLLGSSKKMHVRRSSAIVIEVIGFVKVGSGREVVEAMSMGLRRGREETRAQ